MIKVLGIKRRPAITVHSSGRIDISSHVSKTLRLVPGDTIDVAILGADVFLYVSSKNSDIPGEMQARCRRVNATGNHLRVNSQEIASVIRSQYKKWESRDKIRLACGEPKEIEGLGTAVPIITRELPSM